MTDSRRFSNRRVGLGATIGAVALVAGVAGGLVAHAVQGDRTSIRAATPSPASTPTRTSAGGTAERI